ncbi:MAG: stage 0 sporulation protein [Elusimicrobia bacterium]|nr:stage 0 sporulation protein [Candidatus Liberimonas magnetica]
MPVVTGLIMRRIKDKVLGDPGHLDLNIGDCVIVETEHGQETGTIFEKEKLIEKPKDPIVKIIRKFTPEDRNRLIENEKKNLQAQKMVLQKVEDHELDMKLTTVQYTFDRSKLFIYYTAETRVDFRELIKDLGHILKTRIQMVQIGVRDEAKMIGGLGHCGRELCCKGFLKDFSSVTIDMAKEQDLALNTTKLSGLCGRLMCCLAYEQQNYTEIKKKVPEVGSKVRTPDGPGTVVSVMGLKEEVTVELKDKQTKTYPLSKISHTILDKLGL